MVERPRILSISFSELTSDARVLRQIRTLSEFGDVTTLGYGRRPPDVAEHLEIPECASLPQTFGGVFKLALHRFRSVQLDAPANRAAIAVLGDRSFDLVVANEVRALPLAFAIAKGAPIWGDLHEWAPEERSQVFSWRVLVAPFVTWICTTYLPRTDAITTVGGAIAQLYRSRFGVEVEVVRNSGPLEELEPSPTREDRIRLVHSGAAVPGRNIESIISATLTADDRFTLDLYLLPARDGGRYLRQLRELAGDSTRVRFPAAVASRDLPTVLNGYDVGVYLLPPLTTNQRLALPNKFFDFVQARLALVFGPSEEIGALIRKHDVGLVTSDFSVEALAASFAALTTESIDRFKRNSDRAARTDLNSETDDATSRVIIGRLLDTTSGQAPEGS